MGFPVAVILNRLVTDFFVLIPLGRRINQLIIKKGANYICRRPWGQAGSLN
jgi:hypothetical protein